MLALVANHACLFGTFLCLAVWIQCISKYLLLHLVSELDNLLGDTFVIPKNRDHAVLCFGANHACLFGTFLCLAVWIQCVSKYLLLHLVSELDNLLGDTFVIPKNRDHAVLCFGANHACLFGTFLCLAVWIQCVSKYLLLHLVSELDNLLGDTFVIPKNRASHAVLALVVNHACVCGTFLCLAVWIQCISKYLLLHLVSELDNLLGDTFVIPKNRASHAVLALVVNHACVCGTFLCLAVWIQCISKYLLLHLVSELDNLLGDTFVIPKNRASHAVLALVVNHACVCGTFLCLAVWIQCISKYLLLHLVSELDNLLGDTQCEITGESILHLFVTNTL